MSDYCLAKFSLLSSSRAEYDSATHLGGLCTPSITPSHLLHFITFGFISLHLKAQSITLAFSGCLVLIANVALSWHFTFPAGIMSECLKGHRRHHCHPQATSLKHQQPVLFNKHGRKAGVQPQTNSSVWILLMW